MVFLVGFLHSVDWWWCHCIQFGFQDVQIKLFHLAIYAHIHCWLCVHVHLFCLHIYLETCHFEVWLEAVASNQNCLASTLLISCDLLVQRYWVCITSLIFLRSGMTQSVSMEDAPLSVSVPLPVPLIFSSVSLLILTSGLCGIACAGGERLLISCLMSSCHAFSSCWQALLQVVLIATALYSSHPPSISSAKSSFFCFCLRVFTICLSAKD